jgi:hypothetical protein
VRESERQACPAGAARSETLPRRERHPVFGQGLGRFAARRSRPAAAPANAAEFRPAAGSVDDIDAVVASVRARGAELAGEVERYEDSYRLCYVRGPEGIIVELAEQIGRGLRPAANDGVSTQGCASLRECHPTDIRKMDRPRSRLVEGTDLRSAKSLLEPRVVAHSGEVVVSARVLAEPR